MQRLCKCCKCQGGRDARERKPVQRRRQQRSGTAAAAADCSTNVSSLHDWPCTLLSASGATYISSTPAPEARCRAAGAADVNMSARHGGHQSSLFSVGHPLLLLLRAGGAKKRGLHQFPAPATHLATCAWGSTYAARRSDTEWLQCKPVAANGGGITNLALKAPSPGPSFVYDARDTMASRSRSRSRSPRRARSRSRSRGRGRSRDEPETERCSVLVRNLPLDARCVVGRTRLIRGASTLPAFPWRPRAPRGMRGNTMQSAAARCEHASRTSEAPPPPPPAADTSLPVSRCSMDDVRAKFEKYGAIRDVYLPKDFCE
mgnify:CR=1 FL=1